MQRFDLAAFLDDHGIRYHKNGGGQFVMNCPACGKDRFYINPTSHLFMCFKCGEKGNIFTFIKLVDPERAKEYFRSLLQKTVNGPIKFSLKDPFEHSEFLECDEYGVDVESWASPIGSIPFGNLVFTYLGYRGITLKTAILFNLYYSSEMRRLVFPLFHDNKIMGWIGRDITGTQEPKYLYNHGFKKRKFLYGLNYHHDKESIVLTEGPIDALKAFDHGGMAVLGKYLSKEQFNLLLRMPRLRRIYVGLDADAEEESIQTAQKLSSVFDVKLIEYPVSNKDIGAMQPQEVTRLLDHSHTYRGKTQISFSLSRSA